MLQVTPPTAGEMLKRLEKEGLIKRGARRGALLTDEGQELAEKVVRPLAKKYDAVIFDEAHEIEEIAGQHFGIQLSNYRFEELVRDIRSPLGYIEGDFQTLPLDCGAPELAAFLDQAPGCIGSLRPPQVHDINPGIRVCVRGNGLPNRFAILRIIQDVGNHGLDPLCVALNG